MEECNITIAGTTEWLQRGSTTNATDRQYTSDLGNHLHWEPVVHLNAHESDPVENEELKMRRENSVWNLKDKQIIHLITSIVLSRSLS